VKIPILYLDTSVIGAYFDDEFKEATRALWDQMKVGRYRFVTSLITVDELDSAPVRVREIWADTFRPDMILDVTNEMEELAAAYMAQAVLTPKYTDDARHVAACTISRADYLVSWNFRHLVNVDWEKGFNAVNILQGYPLISIVNPLELIYGDPDENL
jgi:predicted nucleic acid-binding protein